MQAQTQASLGETACAATRAWEQAGRYVEVLGQRIFLVEPGAERDRSCSWCTAIPPPATTIER